MDCMYSRWNGFQQLAHTNLHIFVNQLWHVLLLARLFGEMGLWELQVVSRSLVGTEGKAVTGKWGNKT